MTSHDDTENEMPVTSEEGAELGSVSSESEASVAGSQAADPDKSSGNPEEDVSAASVIPDEMLKHENPAAAAMLEMQQQQATLASRQVGGQTQDRCPCCGQPIRDAQGGVPTSE
ncbi:MAG TPA: hypothetical protein VGR29_11395 [Thermomicrobiales bacterium]|nr:hypothetical protein [Thermomicrobiales bacterium]